MPVILTSRYFDSWLSSAEIKKEKFVKMMNNKGFNADLVGCPVSPYVNSPSHQSEKCIAPLINP